MVTLEKPWFDSDDKKMADWSCYTCVFFDQCRELPPEALVMCERPSSLEIQQGELELEPARHAA